MLRLGLWRCGHVEVRFVRCSQVEARFVEMQPC